MDSNNGIKANNCYITSFVWVYCIYLYVMDISIQFHLEYIMVKPQVKLIGFISLFFLFIQIYLGLGLVQIMLHSHALHFHIVILI